MRRIKLDELPDNVRRQVEDKIRAEDEKRARIAQDAQGTAGQEKTRPDASGRATQAVEPQRRGPNKTEAEYNRLHLHGNGRYEAVTLRLPGGSRYTPDWMTVDEVELPCADEHTGKPVKGPTFLMFTLHEVKGSYRLGSHGRALTAFREAVAAFPFFEFVWAVRKGPGDWDLRKYKGGR